MFRALFPLCLALGLLGAVEGAAQDVAPSPILVIDSERLFLTSDFGIRVVREIEARGNELAAENRQIEMELEAAEQELTNRRALMTPEAFQPLADAFDTRVQETRQAQAAKSRALNVQLEREREAFLNAAGPVLQELMAEAGASVVLERRTVFISAKSADITADAVARLNLDLGEGVPADPASTPAAPNE
jgi:Skp family chaperone for outer membrane proteins